jgi:hypothetical protein
MGKKDPTIEIKLKKRVSIRIKLQLILSLCSNNMVLKLKLVKHERRYVIEFISISDLWIIAHRDYIPNLFP